MALAEIARHGPDMAMEKLPYGLAEYPGYRGVFTRARAAGALANGTRIMKVKSEPGDGRPNGAFGTVLGSMVAPEAARNIVYFIEWDALPGSAVATMDFKVTPQS